MNFRSIFVRAVNRLFPVHPPLCDNLAEWLERNRMGRSWEIEAPVTLEIALPATDEQQIDEAFLEGRRMVCPSRRLSVVPDVVIRGRDGFIILPDGSYLTETAPEAFLRPHPAYKQRIQPRPRKIEGAVFSLFSMYCREHYHWLLDALPRLHVALEHLPPQVRFLVPHDLKPHQYRMLEQCGVDSSRMVLFDEAEPVRVDELWFTPLAAPERYNHPAACAWLRERLLDGRSPAGSARRLFISRQKTRERRCLNESELHHVARDHGFEIIMAEEIPFEEQIRIFAAAEAVAGPHGAGFANALFSPPSTLLLDLFAERVGFRLYFWTLAHACGHRYAYTKGISIPCDRGVNYADFHVDPKRYAQYFRMMLP